MNSWKTITGGVLTLFALLGAAWGLNKQFVPRETYDLQLVGLNKQLLQMQKNNERMFWVLERKRWQDKIEQLQYECGRDAGNQRLKELLDEAIRRRDEAEREIQRLSK